MVTRIFKENAKKSKFLPFGRGQEWTGKDYIFGFYEHDKSHLLLLRTTLTASTVKESSIQETYDWASEEVGAYKSLLSSRKIVNAFARNVMWVGEEMVEDFAVEPCSVEEWVYHSTKEGEGDFIYLYETMIRDLGVIVPFDEYEVNVLKALGVAPTQLHPNG
ncbi:hypothetical protein CR513_32488, partial [Mucuna pruriens]